jgi:hypothetical protein
MRMDRKTFDSKRVSARKHTGTLKVLFQELANASLDHFGEHGDTSYIADLWSDINDYGKNFIRGSSFLKWLVAHSPVQLKDKKFSKDKAREAEIWGTPAAKAAMLAKAYAKSFWDFDPEAAITDFSADDVVESLEKLIKRFENSKRMHAADENAKARVVQIKDFFKTLKAEKPVEPVEGETPAETPTEEAPAQAESEESVVTDASPEGEIITGEEAAA